MTPKRALARFDRIDILFRNMLKDLDAYHLNKRGGRRAECAKIRYRNRLLEYNEIVPHFRAWLEDHTKGG